MNKIVFLVDSISQPRCIRRINDFRNNGFEVIVYGINRNKYNVNLKNLDFEVNIFDLQSEGKNYFSKFFNNFYKVKKVIRLYKDKNVIFYSFGFPLTFSLVFNSCKIYIYEIADILYGYRKFNYLRFFFKYLDLFLIKRSFLTVFTSEGFSHFFFKKNPPNNTLVQENKVNNSLLNSWFLKDHKNFNVRSIKFAFIGSFRSPNTILFFAEIIGKYFPNHEFHFYGDSFLTPMVIDLSKMYSNIKYFGPFSNPDDLPKIYYGVDVVLACYDTNDFNETILEPNKFYECLFYNTPIIVSEGTYISSKVKEMKSGFVLNASNSYNIIEFIKALSISSFEPIWDSFKNKNRSSFIDEESKKIISFIKSNFPIY